VALVHGPPLVITLPVLNIVCRWVPGSGLDGMLCDCHAPGPCEHRVAAVLAAQAAAGVRALEEDTTALEAATGAPRTRAEVLAAVGDVLAELVGQGVSRAAQALYEELQTLAVSAHGVDLPRLERQLNALADEVRLLRARDAQADTRNLLRAAATVEALRTALAHPTPALVGVHRSRYDPVGRLELLGLGAGRWRTRSGYHGVTAYFWDIGGRQWATWTEARPLTAPGGFDPAARFRDQGPWLGCPSVAQTSGSRVRLTGAWRNGEGRLSGREGIQAVVPGAADPAQGPPPLDDWAQVAEQARRCFRPGLRDADAREALVLLAPARWEAADFDEVRQELTRVIRDAAGRELALWVPYREETAGAVAWLEACRPGGAARVLGTLRLLRGRLVVEPISLHEPPRVTHLTLDPPPKASAFTRLLHAFGGRGSAEDETAATPTGLLLEALLAELEIVAEAGVAARGDTTHLAGLLDDARAIGLASLAAAGTRLLDALARRHRPDAATTLLRAAYLVHLAITAEALLQATG
jgi:hypothetical protein